MDNDNPSDALRQNGNVTLAKLTRTIHERQPHLARGGGLAAIDRQHPKNRLTAREKIDLPLDLGPPVLEWGGCGGWQMHQPFGAAPAADRHPGVNCCEPLRWKSFYHGRTTLTP
jgi:acetyl-CoA carboxylase carboxyltransferase component